MRKIAILPTLLTLGNGVCGFAAIVHASKIGMVDSAGQDEMLFAICGWLILAAMIFDMFDGYVARLSKTASNFGGELDSLCDAISFGVAPAFLLIKMGPGWARPMLHQMLVGIAVLYMTCTVLRLARFNVNNAPDPASHKRFRGLPSPAAAGCIASLAILRGELPAVIVQFWPGLEMDTVRQTVHRLVEGSAPIGALVVALLMVSLVPYPHVTKQIFRGRRHVGHLIQILLAVFILFLLREVALALVFWVYALFFPLRSLASQYLPRHGLPTPRLDDATPPPG